MQQGGKRLNKKELFNEMLWNEQLAPSLAEAHGSEEKAMNQN
jgi:hypothetical protein